MDMKELERQYEEAIKQGICPKGMVVINPGNPTGMVWNEYEIIEIIIMDSVLRRTKCRSVSVSV